MSINRISPEETKELLDGDEGQVYIDVRTVDEYEAAHIPGTKNIPVMERGPGGMTPNPNFVGVVEANFAKDAKIITGCLRGGRSMRAAQMLIASGFTDVTDMRGGFDGEMAPGGAIAYDGWSRRGLPVSSESEPKNRYEELAKKASE